MEHQLLAFASLRPEGTSDTANARAKPFRVGTRFSKRCGRSTDSDVARHRLKAEVTNAFAGQPSPAFPRRLEHRAWLQATRSPGGGVPGGPSGVAVAQIMRP